MIELKFFSLFLFLFLFPPKPQLSSSHSELFILFLLDVKMLLLRIKWLPVYWSCFVSVRSSRVCVSCEGMTQSCTDVYNGFHPSLHFSITERGVFSNAVYVCVCARVRACVLWAVFYFRAMKLFVIHFSCKLIFLSSLYLYTEGLLEFTRSLKVIHELCVTGTVTADTPNVMSSTSFCLSFRIICILNFTSNYQWSLCSGFGFNKNEITFKVQKHSQLYS